MTASASLYGFLVSIGTKLAISAATRASSFAQLSCWAFPKISICWLLKSWKQEGVRAQSLASFDFSVAMKSKSPVS